MWIDDQIIKDCSKRLAYKVFVPPSPMVVLGRSNKEEREAHVERCQRDGVPILKRYGGGGTVLLHRGCVVVSIGAWVSSPYHNDRYFSALNNSIITAMSPLFPELGFRQRGYSDIVKGQRKFAGTSLFRSRTYLLYQASLLVDLQIEQIETYLQHPSKEPDYRQGRSHREFLLGLNELYPGLSSQMLSELIEKRIETAVLSHMEDEITEPLEAHISHLLQRVEGSH